MSCGVGHRRGWDPALLWLWRRPAATAPIGPLGWEPPYAEGAALEKKTKKKKRKSSWYQHCLHALGINKQNPGCICKEITISKSSTWRESHPKDQCLSDYSNTNEIQPCLSWLWKANISSLFKNQIRSCHHSAAETIWLAHKDSGLIPGLTRWVKDPALLWAVV